MEGTVLPYHQILGPAYILMLRSASHGQPPRIPDSNGWLSYDMVIYGQNSDIASILAMQFLCLMQFALSNRHGIDCIQFGFLILDP